jgi:hypothetical protein
MPSESIIHAARLQTEPPAELPRRNPPRLARNVTRSWRGLAGSGWSLVSRSPASRRLAGPDGGLCRFASLFSGPVTVCQHPTGSELGMADG